MPRTCVRSIATFRLSSTNTDELRLEFSCSTDAYKLARRILQEALNHEAGGAFSVRPIYGRADFSE